uniref:WGS project CAEQ00000000 data, annotated contig 1577 n=1 Tax=Trypanosoma congolense (strain IL3000) TaxID=1068625 RepID=F9W776_TRYCI|nr:unnamed protein product [Trypanosoma congolense IL3000]
MGGSKAAELFWVFESAAQGLHMERRRLLKPNGIHNLIDINGAPFKCAADAAEATLWRTHHAFSGRCGIGEAAGNNAEQSDSYGGLHDDIGANGPPTSHTAENYRDWTVNLHLRSYSAEPHVLVSVAPHCLPSRGKGSSFVDSVYAKDEGACRWPRDWGPQTKEEQSAYDAAVLGTPLIWEEPLVLSVECTTAGMFLWSEDYEMYGEKVADRCFEKRDESFSGMDGSSIHKAGDACRAESLYKAFLRVRWRERQSAPPGEGNEGCCRDGEEKSADLFDLDRCSELYVYQGAPGVSKGLASGGNERNDPSGSELLPHNEGVTWRQVLHRLIPCGSLPVNVHFAPYVTLMDGGDEALLF